MPSDLFMNTVQIAVKAVKHYSVDHERLCQFARDQLDIMYGRHWQCVASTYPYGAYFWFLPGRYIKLNIDGITMTIFKCD